MNLIELKKLVSNGESDTLEFKKSTGLLKAVFQTMSAFANHKGGTVLVGVLDNGSLVGQEVTENTRQKITSELSKIEPPAQVDIAYVSINKIKKVIVFSVSVGAHAPYTYDGRAYYRELDSTIRMPQHRYEQLLIARGQLNYTWESTLLNEYGINDLDHEEIHRTISIGEKMRRVPISALKVSVSEMLERLDLLKDGVLTRAALVLFGKEHAVFSQCEIKMARFRGTDKLGDFIDSRHVQGNTFRLLEEVDSFLARHLPIASFFKKDQFERINKPILPVLAVREALINALIHRDYAHTGASISLAIFDDRLEIWSYGALPKELTLNALKSKHSSVLRNKLIANIFYIRDLIETWGTGTNKMVDLCQKENIPEPIFEENTGGVSVLLRFKMPIGHHVSLAQESVGLRGQEILDILRVAAEPLSVHDVLLKIVTPPSLRTVKADLSQLQKLGLVEQVGKARNTRWRLSH